MEENERKISDEEFARQYEETVQKYESLAEVNRFNVPMNVELLDHMGSDLDVVNAARVSFNKESYFLQPRDENLIRYLAKNGHWTPFSHCFMKFRIKMPIFVARQLVRHTIGVTINEVSRRYVSTPPEYYRVDLWREKAEHKKQGSKETGVENQQACYDISDMLTHSADEAYDLLLRQGVCPEQARMVLPLNTMTEWIYSGSLYAFARIVNLRVHPHAQYEVSIIGQRFSSYAKVLFPVSWESLVAIQ